MFLVWPVFWAISGLIFGYLHGGHGWPAIPLLSTICALIAGAFFTVIVKVGDYTDRLSSFKFSICVSIICSAISTSFIAYFASASIFQVVGFIAISGILTGILITALYKLAFKNGVHT